MISSFSQVSVFVTGAASGLGKAIAQAYLAADANVAICDINKERLDTAIAEWGSDYGDKFIAFQGDVSDESSVNKMVADTILQFGSLDILINNAGIMDKFDPAGSCDKAIWDRVMAVNLTGPFLLTKAAIAQFELQKQNSDDKETSGGIIINIGSVASIEGLVAGVAYTCSKHGIMALTKNTAGFYGDKGIYSIALLLGYMETNITDSFATGMNQESIMQITNIRPSFSEGRMSVHVEDVAKYCVFLSDRNIAASANGSCIVFNKNWPVA